MCGNEVEDYSPTCSADAVVWWLHFPKCGTSFKTTWCECPMSATRNPSQHQLLQDSDDVSQVVAIFRDPSQRLASTYAFVKLAGVAHKDQGSGDQVEACCLTDWGWTDEQRSKVLDLLDKEVDIGKDDYLQSFRGCQTNMILGQGCMSQYAATKSEIEKAVERVNSFFFVGLLEEWPLSVCLFNRKATGKHFVRKEQLEDGRPSSADGSGGPNVYETNGYAKDDADEAVYASVQKRFEAELAEYKVSITSCSFDERGNPYEIPPEFYSHSKHSILGDATSRAAI